MAHISFKINLISNNLHFDIYMFLLFFILHDFAHVIKFEFSKAVYLYSTLN
jgi:hypothetical protein